MITPLASPNLNVRSKFLYGIIKELGLTTSLNCVLDVADLTSYDGSSQTWTDATGQGNNFFRGVDGSATATDPTFTGTAGLASEATYFLFDGGDFMKETTGHTFAAGWHKNNGAFTVLAVMYLLNKTAQTRVFTSKAGAAGDAGISFNVADDNTVNIGHSTSTAATESLLGTNALAAASWNFAAVTFDEATTTASIITNGTAETFTPTASTDTDAAQALRIGSNSDGPLGPFENTERLACMAMWSTKVSDVNVTAIYTRLKSRRFTSLP